jgi:Na+-transporting NADH:ubiquinone oxidoreductase subunit B
MSSPQQEGKPILRKQAIMRRVVIASVPCMAGSVYFFGWRSLAVVAVSCLFGFLTEYLFCRSRGEPVSEAVFVSAVIFALVVPPNVPWHVLIFGIVFAIAFGKEVFGGFGRNVFNPAMTGRCFVYVCFPVSLTSRWALPAQGPWGALKQWTTAATPDAITAATPMTLAKFGEAPPPELVDLLIGRMSGSMGVTSALLILVGGLYIYYTKTANRSMIVTHIVTYGLLYQALHMLGVRNFYDGPTALLSAGFLFGAFFIITDPVSSPSTQPARIIYAVLVAVLAIIIRNFSVFNAGYMFSVLIANMFVPILDYAVKEQKKRKMAATAGKATG